MKNRITIVLLLFTIANTFAQSDSAVVMPGSGHIQLIYNIRTKTKNMSYNYSNEWDVDGDKKNDSLYFIGNGGAHAYFYLRLQLSSTNKLLDFPFLQLDMPYLNKVELLDKYGKNPGIQWVVHDFDNDGILDMYFNFDNPMGKIPSDWKQMGVTSKQVIMSFAEGKLKVRDYETTPSK
jgi:hypothetical protein